MKDFEAAFLMEGSGDLTDAEWRISIPRCPDRGERGQPISFKRRAVDGVLWVLSTGAVALHAGKIRQLEFGVRALHALEQTRWSKQGA